MSMIPKMLGGTLPINTTPMVALFLLLLGNVVAFAYPLSALGLPKVKHNQSWFDMGSNISKLQVHVNNKAKNFSVENFHPVGRQTRWPWFRLWRPDLHFLLISSHPRAFEVSWNTCLIKGDIWVLMPAVWSLIYFVLCLTYEVWGMMSDFWLAMSYILCLMYDTYCNDSTWIILFQIPRIHWTKP